MSPPPLPTVWGGKEQSVDARHGFRSATLCHAPFEPSVPVLAGAHVTVLGIMKSCRLNATSQSWFTQ